MKNYALHLSRSKLLLLLIIVLFTNSCKKDHGNAISETKTELISDARNYFEKIVLKNNLKQPNDPNYRHNLLKRPVWEDASIKKIAIGDAVIIPIKYDKAISLKPEGTPQTTDLNKTSYMMIYKDSKQNLHAEWITLIADKTNKATNFIGIAQIEEWNGKPKRAFAFGAQGKILPVRLSESINYEQASYTKGYNCYTIEYYGWVGVEGYMVQQMIGSETYCSWSQPGSGPTDSSKPEENEGGTNPSDQPSPGDYPIVTDCAGVPNGTASDNNACQTCMGGTTGISECPLELKTDSLKAKFPCANKLIAQPILTSPIMSRFVEPFLTPQRPTITYLTDNTLPWGNATTWGTFTLGNNGPDPTSGLGQSSIVRFNEKMLQNSSQLLIAATLVHETLHAYIKYTIATANYNYVNSDESNWMVGLDSFYLMGNLPSNYSNHTMMLEDYFEKSLAVLQAWNAQQGFIYSTKDMASAMLYGLDTYDVGTSQSLINNITTVFQTVKTKYSISAADLTTFNKANLIAITNKLPTTGCN